MYAPASNVRTVARSASLAVAASSSYIIPDISTSIARTFRAGLTLVLFSAQRKRFLWDRGCIYELLYAGVDEVSGGIRGC